MGILPQSSAKQRRTVSVLAFLCTRVRCRGNPTAQKCRHPTLPTCLSVDVGLRLDSHRQYSANDTTEWQAVTHLKNAKHNMYCPEFLPTSIYLYLYMSLHLSLSISNYPSKTAFRQGMGVSWRPTVSRTCMALQQAGAKPCHCRLYKCQASHGEDWMGCFATRNALAQLSFVQFQI